MTVVDIRVPDDGSIVLVDGLSLPGGSVTVLFGPNGAGKSTVMRRLAGIGGREPLLACAYQPQVPYLFRGLAGTNLGLGLDAEEAGRAGALAAELGIRDLLTEPAHALSGGERQRLALARTLGAKADWVLLDEPLNAIDRQDRNRVLGVLTKSLGGRSAVVVTHDLDVAAALGDEIAVMQKGRLLQQGAVGKVLSAPASVDVARVLGVGNLLEGSAQSEAGFSVVTAGTISVVGRGSVDGPARAIVPAESVVLAGADAGDTSARNRWRGTVTEVRRGATVFEIVIDIGLPLVSIVTVGGAEDLGLEVGSQVVASVKATSVSVVPA